MGQRSVIVQIRTGMFCWGFMLLVAACATAPVQAPSFVSAVDATYAGILSQQYDAMGSLLSVNGHNHAASIFNTQFTHAATGRWVEPQTPPPEDDRTALKNERAILMTGLNQMMTGENALWLARAQVNFDCWVLVREDACQRDFEKAIRSLTIPKDFMLPQSVYFAPDSSELSEETRIKLMDMAHMLRMNKILNIRVLGHTDYLDSNQSLALRRAIAVRNLIAQMGVATDRIAVKDEDHGDTILSQQRPELTDNPAAHRVDIIFEPVFGQAI